MISGSEDGVQEHAKLKGQLFCCSLRNSLLTPGAQNFKPSITRFKEAEHWISILSTELHLRLREARELNPGLWVRFRLSLCDAAELTARQPKTITFSHRSEQYVSRSHQLPFPFTSRLDIAYIKRFGMRLLKSALGEKNVPITADTRIGPYNNLSIAFSGLEQLEEGQKGIEGFFTMAEPPSAIVDAAKEPELETVDSHVDPDKRKAVETIDLVSSPSPRKKARTVKASPARSKKKAVWRCDKCGKTLSSDVCSDSTVEEQVNRLADEHRDYHFARDLLERERKRDHAKAKPYTRIPPAGDASSSKLSAKANKGQQSIAGFFRK